MAGGLLDAVKGLTEDLFALLQTRLELLSIDLEEERVRIVSLLVAILVALFFFGLGILFLAILLVVAFWNTHPIAVLGLFTLIFLVAGVIALWFAFRQARARPRLFSVTVSELAKDREQLAPRHERPAG